MTCACSASSRQALLRLRLALASLDSLIHTVPKGAGRRSSCRCGRHPYRQECAEPDAPVGRSPSRISQLHGQQPRLAGGRKRIRLGAPSRSARHRDMTAGTMSKGGELAGRGGGQGEPGGGEFEASGILDAGRTQDSQKAVIWRMIRAATRGRVR